MSAAYLERKLERILIVDDNKDILEFTAFVLKLYGKFDVTTARTGIRALSAISKQAPDLILLDLKMPELGGYETLIRLKQDIRTRDIPVIIMTCNSNRDYLHKLQDFGIDSYILKPFNPETLVEDVSKKWSKISNRIY